MIYNVLKKLIQSLKLKLLKVQKSFMTIIAIGMGTLQAPPLRAVDFYLTDEKAMLYARQNVHTIEKIAELKNKG